MSDPQDDYVRDGLARARKEIKEKARRLAVAREAVVEAAKEWEPYYSRINDRQALANAKMRLSAAVAHLLEVESEHG